MNDLPIFTLNKVYGIGDIVPVSGQYAVVNALGQFTGLEITAVAREKFPPHRSLYGARYRLIDRTVHLNNLRRFIP